MVPHKNLVIASYVVASLYFGHWFITNFDSIVSTQRAFFDMAPAWQVNASVAVIALAPVAYLAVALAVHRDAKFSIVGIPAIVALLLTIGLAAMVLFGYLVLYYFVYSPRDNSNANDQ